MKIMKRKKADKIHTAKNVRTMEGKNRESKAESGASSEVWLDTEL